MGETDKEADQAVRDRGEQYTVLAYRQARQQLADAKGVLLAAIQDKQAAEGARDQLITQYEPILAGLDRDLAEIEERDGQKAAKQSDAWGARKRCQGGIAAAKKTVTAANAALRAANQAVAEGEAVVEVALAALCRTSLVHEVLDDELTNAVVELIAASGEKNRLEARADELSDFLRRVIEVAPTGHTTAAISADRVYKAWLNRAGKVGACLQLSPSYYYDLLELLRRFTLENLHAVDALKIDRGPLEKAAAADKLKDCKGEKVTAEILEETFLHFDADAFRPKVKPFTSEQPLTDVVTNFQPGDLRPLEESGLEPKQVELIKEHTDATTVQDVMAMPAAKLAAIPGIGPKGYAKILQGISGKPHHPAI